MTEQVSANSAQAPLQTMFTMCSRHVAYALGFSAVISLLNLVPTLYMLQIYDRVLASKSGMTLVFLSLFTVIALWVLAYLDGVRSKILASLGSVLDKTLWPQLASRQLSDGGLGPRHGTFSHGDFDSLKTILTGPVALACLDLPWSALYIAIAFLLHWAIGLFALLAFALFVALAVIYELSTSGLVNEAGVRNQNQQVVLAEINAQRQTLRALGMTGHLAARLVTARAASLSPQRAAHQIAAHYGAIVKFARLTLQSATLGLAAWLAIGGDISAGAIFASSMLASRALAPMDGLLTQWRSLAQVQSVWLRLKAFLSVAPPASLTELARPASAVRLDRISLLSPDRSRYLIRDVSLDLTAGITVVAGPTGSGKSLLLKLIANAIRPDTGNLRLGGTDYGLWETERLGKLMGYVPQEMTVISGTVRDNIARFDPTADDRQVITSAQVAGAHDLIMRLPQGYDTVLGSGALSPSPGLWQRIAFARAVHGTPPVYILDDPTAGLDGEGEVMLTNLVRRLKAAGALIIMATHRTSLMSAADHVVLLREGRCVSQGSPGSVLTSSALNGGPNGVNGPRAPDALSETLHG